MISGSGVTHLGSHGVPRLLMFPGGGETCPLLCQVTSVTNTLLYPKGYSGHPTRGCIPRPHVP